MQSPLVETRVARCDVYPCTVRAVSKGAAKLVLLENVPSLVHRRRATETTSRTLLEQMIAYYLPRNRGSSANRSQHGSAENEPADRTRFDGTSRPRKILSAERRPSTLSTATRTRGRRNTKHLAGRTRPKRAGQSTQRYSEIRIGTCQGFHRPPPGKMGEILRPRLLYTGRNGPAAPRQGVRRAMLG